MADIFHTVRKNGKKGSFIKFNTDYYDKISNKGAQKLRELLDLEVTSKDFGPNIPYYIAMVKMEIPYKIFDYYFTNREIYVHKVLENETSDINLENDYYLAPLSDADNTLYPYMYDENSQSYQLVENGVTDSEGNILFASGYNGKYVYSDLCPIISGVSGALFTFDSENNTYTVLEDAKSALNECFLIDKHPFKIDGFEEAPTFTLTLDDNKDLSNLDVDYAFIDTMNAIIYNGTINVTFTDLNNISLDDIINQ